MTAYVVASIHVTDPVAYEDYRAAVIPTLMAHDCNILVADYASEAIEGRPNEVTVILEFASKEAASAWYKSPEYEAIKHLRTDHSEGTVVLVDQWAAPE